MSGSGAMIAVLDNTDSVKSSYAVKVGLAQMLRGGVIMEVVNPEQARIAEEAGAVAIVATDVARGAELGMVMRMSDPVTIKEIKKAVTIPVMAKARVGHFVEAQVLEAIGVDFVDESEALIPADSANYINKHKFRIPFVCGCNNLGDALRRIAEGAAMVRTRTEAFTNGSGGDVSEAVRHARAVVGEIRKLQSLDEDELYSLARQASAPLELARLTKQLGRLPVVNFAAGGVTTPADAALMMQLGCDGVFIGSHIFSGTNPSLRARSIVKAVAHYHDAQVLADVSSLNFGEPMHGVNLATNTTLG